MTSHKSKKLHRKKQPNIATQMRIIKYPMKLPIPNEWKERVRAINGCETPRSLFKFERPERDRILALHEKLAYFASPYAFNDTQDCRLAIDCSLSKEELDFAISSENRWLTTISPLQRLEDLDDIGATADIDTAFSAAFFRAIRNAYKGGGHPLVDRMLREFAAKFAHPIETGGIYCLTDNWQSESMWENYAAKGSGFVLEFDPKTSAICWDASPVEYVEAFPKIRLYSSAMSGTMQKDALRVPLTKMREKWWQEKEWRTWRKLSGFYYYGEKSLVSVTFGPKIKDDVANALLAIVAAKYGLGVRVYEARAVNGELIRIPMM